MKIYTIYAAIPGKEKIFFNSYTSERKAYEDRYCLREIGLEVEMRVTELT